MEVLLKYFDDGKMWTGALVHVLTNISRTEYCIGNTSRPCQTVLLISITFGRHYFH
jgi:hypothetical protein